MTHDMELLDRLDGLQSIEYDGVVYRATRLSLDPLAPSTNGGRWAPRNELPVLYTSLEREGALAELSFYWNQLTPRPSKPAALHHLKVSTRKTLRLIKADLTNLGVDFSCYHKIEYPRCQEIGAAVGFLEYDGLIVPSARWECDNLVIFTDNHTVECHLEITHTEQIEWQQWADENL